MKKSDKQQIYFLTYIYNGIFQKLAFLVWLCFKHTPYPWLEPWFHCPWLPQLFPWFHPPCWFLQFPLWPPPQLPWLPLQFPWLLPQFLPLFPWFPHLFPPLPKFLPPPWRSYRIWRYDLDEKFWQHCIIIFDYAIFNKIKIFLRNTRKTNALFVNETNWNWNDPFYKNFIHKI